MKELFHKKPPRNQQVKFSCDIFTNTYIHKDNYIFKVFLENVLLSKVRKKHHFTLKPIFVFSFHPLLL